MDNQKIQFKKATKTDQELIRGWLKKPHVKEYWDNLDERLENLDTFLKGKKGSFDHWICSYEKTPFALLLTSDAAAEAADYLLPWLESEGMTLMIDFVIAEKSFLGKGFSSATLKRFAEVQEPSISAFASDPEVKNERAIHVYEKAGFVKVATFIRGEGFFKGKPHYLMKMKILH